MTLWPWVYGCGEVPVQSDTTHVLVGQSISQVVTLWGSDYESVTDAAGTHYTWVYEGYRLTRIRSGAPAAAGSSGGSAFGTPVEPAPHNTPKLVAEYCRLVVTTNADDIVIDWHGEGTACEFALHNPDLW